MMHGQQMSENAKAIQRLVIRLPNWVGDAVMATPGLRSMRRGFPDAQITWLGKSGILKILQGLPYYDETLEVESRGVAQVLRTASRLRATCFDLGLILPNSFSSALSFYLGGVKHRIGYALNHRNLLLSRSIRPVMEGRKRRPEPMTRYYRDLAIFAGGADAGEHMELCTEPQHDEAVDRLFRRYGLDGAPLKVGLNPGASFGPSKLWTSEGFAGVADRIVGELKGRALLLMGPKEEAIADAILARVEFPLADTSREVIPLDLLKSVIARLDALVTTDTGPRHFAAALGIPCVVLMGPTDPRYTAYAMNSTRVLRRDVSCGPCHKKTCDEDHRCMTRITSDDVFDSLKAVLAQGRVGARGGNGHG
jgi:heptosyltransferase-2